LSVLQGDRARRIFIYEIAKKMFISLSEKLKQKWHGSNGGTFAWEIGDF
jgi:hypothetical protein